MSFTDWVNVRTIYAYKLIFNKVNCISKQSFSLSFMK